MNGSCIKVFLSHFDGYHVERDITETFNVPVLMFTHREDYPGQIISGMIYEWFSKVFPNIGF